MKPISPYRKRIIYPFFVFLLFSPTLFSQSLHLYINPEESLGLLDQAFTEDKTSFLDSISSDPFYNSAAYSYLKSLICANFLNFNYRNETIEKEFLIKDRLKKLVVLLDRNKPDRTWSVSDVFFKENDQIELIKVNSFSSLSYATYFYEFLLAVNKKDLKYFGVGPKGKLNINDLNSLELELSSSTKIIYKNIIVHDGKTPIDFIYIVLKDYPCSSEVEKCGWLIAHAGSMKEFYQNDLFVQFLLDKTQYPNLESPNQINRSIDISSFHDKGLLEARKGNKDLFPYLKSEIELYKISPKQKIKNQDHHPGQIPDNKTTIPQSEKRQEQNKISVTQLPPIKLKPISICSNQTL